MDNVVTIKLDLPNPGACMTANIDKGTMCVEIKRADAGYIIDVWDRAGDFVNSLTVWDNDLEEQI